MYLRFTSQAPPLPAQRQRESPFSRLSLQYISSSADTNPPSRGLQQSLYWCGIANCYCEYTHALLTEESRSLTDLRFLFGAGWADFDDGTCGMLASQISPFGDMNVIGLLVGLESAIHAQAV